MPNCQNCGYKWSWLDTVKIGLRNNKKCPNCKKRQYVSPQWGKRNYAIYLLPMFIILFSRPLFNLSDVVFHLLAILFIVSMVIITPYTIKLSNEQEPLW